MAKEPSKTRTENYEEKPSAKMVPFNLSKKDIEELNELIRANREINEKYEKKWQYS